jgi:hypothetical protein
MRSGKRQDKVLIVQQIAKFGQVVFVDFSEARLQLHPSGTPVKVTLGKMLQKRQREPQE